MGALDRLACAFLSYSNKIEIPDVCCCSPFFVSLLEETLHTDLQTALINWTDLSIAMLDQGAGVIVNISSGAATGALEGWSHYNASKAAALSLTRTGDAEYRAQGIRIVGFSPGTVMTGMQVAIKASGLNPVSQLDLSVHKDPSVPAQVIAWLCSNDAADCVGDDVSIHDEAIRRRAGLFS